MAIGNAKRFVELGAAVPLSLELAKQITASTGNMRRLIELGMPPQAAKRVAAYISTGTSSRAQLVESGLIPRIVRELGIQIGSAVPLLGLNSRVTYVGDSITAYAGSRGYRMWAQYYSRGRAYAGPTSMQGVSGNTTTDLLARMAAVLATSPKIAVVLIGTNNMPSTATAAQTQADLRSVYDQLIAVGAKVVAVQIMPRIDPTFTANQAVNQAKMDAVNAWIATQADVSVVRQTDYALDTSTDLIDQLHPNTAGAKKVGTAIAAKINALVVMDDILLSTPAAGGNILTYGSLGGTGGYGGGGSGSDITGVIPVGWATTNNAPGLTCVSSIDSSKGYNELVIQFSGTVTTAGYIGISQNAGQPYSGVAGDIWEMWAELGVIGTGPIRTLHGSGDALETQFGSGDTASAGPVISGGVIRPFTGALSGNDANNGVTWRVLIDLGATAGTLRFSRPMLRKVQPGDY